MLNKKTTINENVLYNSSHNMSELNTNFRKKGLDFLKERYNKTTDDFIKDTYPKKEQANMRVKISRLINKNPNAPKYFGALELASDLATYFNKFRTNGDPFISVNYFLGDSATVPIVGALFGNGQIKEYKSKEIKNCFVPIRYNGCHAIISNQSSSNGIIRLYKPRTKVYPEADYKFGMAQDKNSKIIWFGFIEPQSNGTYNIVDKSYSTNKTIGNLAENIKLSWSSKIVFANYPSYWDY
jgi:hypothetical protein